MSEQCTVVEAGKQRAAELYKMTPLLRFCMKTPGFPRKALRLKRWNFPVGGKQWAGKGPSPCILLTMPCIMTVRDSTLGAGALPKQQADSPAFPAQESFFPAGVFADSSSLILASDSSCLLPSAGKEPEQSVGAESSDMLDKKPAIHQCRKSATSGLPW